MTPFFFELRLDWSNHPGVLSNHLKAVIDFLNYFCYNNIIKRKEINTMTEEEIKKILQKIRNLDDSIRYWVFKEYIKDYKDLDFLKAEIEYEMGVRK